MGLRLRESGVEGKKRTSPLILLNEGENGECVTRAGAAQASHEKCRLRSLSVLGVPKPENTHTKPPRRVGRDPLLDSAVKMSVDQAQ